MINGINHVTLSVQNLDSAFDFYRNTLGFRPFAKRRGKSAYFLSGDDWVVLVQAKRKHSEDASYAHLAFSVHPKDFDALESKIRSSGAIIWQENSSPGESLYFLDPSGNRLEVHSGDWRSRLQWLKENASNEVTLFDLEGMK